MPIQLARKALLATAPFSPLDLPGLVLWLDASRITGLSDGDPVPTWSDLSGQGNHATQATGAARPTFKTGIVNGRPVVRFDGTDDWLQCANAIARSAETVFVVVNIADALADYCAMGAPIDGGYSLRRRTSSTEWCVAGFTDGTVALRSGTAIATGAFVVLEGERSVADNVIAIYGSGTLLKSTTHSSGSVSEEWTIGRRGGGVELLKGDVAEVIGCSQRLSLTLRSKTRAYLGGKYGMAVA